LGFSLEKMRVVSALLLALVAAEQETQVPSEIAGSVALSEQIEAVECAANTYYWGVWENRHYCVKCPTGLTSPACADCSPDPQHTKCVEALSCAVGQYANAGACDKCPAGKWQSKAGQTGCYGCPSGMFQPTPGMHSCYWCAVGRFSDATGASACKKCNECKQGTYGTTAATGSKDASDCSCKNCEVGKYTPAGYTTCFGCPAGRFQPKEGQYSCYYCPAGKFQDITTAQDCKACSAGQSTDDKGKSAESSCDVSHFTVDKCPVGEYKYHDTKTQKVSCLECPAGMYGKLVSETYGGHCFQCGDGKIQPNKKQSECTACPSGSFADKDHLTCVADKDTVAIEFAAYDYTLASTIQGEGWHLMTYEDMGNAAYSDLFNEDYRVGKGLQLLKTFTSHGCCLTVAMGYRLTANGVSFVYPVNAAGNALKCSEAGETYDASEKLRLVFHNGEGLAEVTNAKSLYAAQGSGMCAKKDGEHNPAIFYRKTTVVEEGQASDFCREVGAQKMCLKAMPTPAPTMAPTKMPTKAPTKTPCPQVTCHQQETEHCKLIPSDEKDSITGCPKHPCGVVQCSPVHCQVTKFGTWSSCDKTCGTGDQERRRSVVQPPMHGGNACPILVDVRNCNTTPCPSHCVMTAWSTWTLCSKTCGGGKKSRQRSVATQARHGGVCDKETSEKEDCATEVCPTPAPTHIPSAAPTSLAPTASPTENPTLGPTNNPTPKPTVAPTLSPTNTPTTDPTFAPSVAPTHNPVHCVWKWGAWTSCTLTCGSGTQSRIRSIIVEAEYNGQQCPSSMLESQNCNPEPCPVNCVVEEWATWSTCDKSCGTGNHERSRKVTTHATYGGNPCPALYEEKSCVLMRCPVDCQTSEWSEWDVCSHECGTGHQERFQQITVAAAHGGVSCPKAIDLVQKKSCLIKECPVNCAVASWTGWGECSKSCGTGEWSRTRKVEQPAEYGGITCPDLREEEVCHLKPCPIHCKASLWSAWSECSKTCGVGTQIRTREEQTKAQNGGNSCGALSQTQACETEICPVDCEVGVWEKWTECTKTCGGGVKTRRRFITQNVEYGGKDCPHVQETDACNHADCPVDCQMSGWSDWSECDKTCGTGDQHRTRTELFKAEHGGKVCPAAKENKACAPKPCPVDCLLTAFTAWTTCSRSCDTGYKQRNRKVVNEAQHGGVSCHHLTETEKCGTMLCPVDCAVSGWGDWEECSKTCGGGSQYRTRRITMDPANGGVKCPALSLEQACAPEPCPVDCTVTAWGKFTACSRSCGEGWKVRTRKTTQEAAYGGLACPAVEDTVACNKHSCPVDCAVDEWGHYGECSQTCGNGITKRVRPVIMQTAYGGKECPPLDEIKACNAGPCPTHCSVSEWSTYSMCTVSCGEDGKKTRYRTVTKHALHGGYTCPSLSETADCDVPHCPVDCTVSEWGAWSECSKSCGGGVTVRTRHVTQEMKYGGKCPLLLNESPCNTKECAVDCEVNEWSSWSACSATCGGGKRSRTRSAIQMPNSDGKACPVLTLSENCNEDDCARNCIVSEFGEWTKCGVTEHSHCARGQFRQITQLPTTGGKLCPTLKKWEECDFGECASESASGCSHVTCSFFIRDDGRGSVQVKHHNKEHNGKKHFCKQEEDGKTCACVCSGEANEPWSQPKV